MPLKIAFMISRTFRRSSSCRVSTTRNRLTIDSSDRAPMKISYPMPFSSLRARAHGRSLARGRSRSGCAGACRRDGADRGHRLYRHGERMTTVKNELDSVPRAAAP